jgi:sigma-B regulation protein RsbU (phosphoserine phosphatase)
MGNPFQPSYFVMGVSLLNLLMVVAGLLLVYFDWSAARRRELLYLVFTEEKPGQSYFSSARRRRALYTRLLAAFSVLTIHQLIEANLFASITEPSHYGAYLDWWRSDLDVIPTGTTANALLQALRMQVWWQVTEALGFTLLGAGLLYDARARRRVTIDTLTLAMVALWAILVLLLVSRIYGIFGGALPNMLKAWTPIAMASRNFASIFRLVVGFGVLVALLTQSREEHKESDFSRTLLVAAFTMWVSGGVISLLPSSGDSSILTGLPGNPAAISFGCTISFALLLSMIAKHVLAEYEVMERSRHRLGRERQVIIAFLQRIGAAFSTAPDMETVLEIILSSALETTEAHAAAIYPYHVDTGRYGPPVIRHFFPPLYEDTSAAYAEHHSGATEVLLEQAKKQSFALGEGIIGEVAKTIRARLVPDVRAEDIVRGKTTQYFRDYSMLVVPLRVRDEPQAVIAVLQKQRGSFNTEDQSLLQAVADQGALVINHVHLTAEAREQARLRRELEIAHDIQQRLLPDRCPIIPGFEIGAFGSAAHDVGGDYYDFFEVDDDHLGIVVADVSGKGVHAALVVAMMRSAFRMQAKDNLDVKDVLNRVNEFIGNDLRRDMFITCVYGILEVSSRRFTWARAGHEPLVLAHPDDSTDVLAPAGFALGVLGSPDFDQLLEVDTVTLRSGDRILLFTDGLTEAMNSRGEEFGMQRILRVLSHSDPTVSVSGQAANTKSQAPKPVAISAEQTPALDPCKPQLVAHCGAPLDIEEPADLISMERAVENHVDGAPQSDDLTMVFLVAK